MKKKSIVIIIGLLISLQCAGCFLEKQRLFAVQDTQTGKYGYVDQHANMKVDCIYELALPFRNGLAEVHQNANRGRINQKGDIVIPIEYDNIWSAQSKGLYIVSKDGKRGIVSDKGDIVVPIEYEEITECDDSYAWVKENGEMLLYDIEHQEKKKVLPDVKICAVRRISKDIYAYTTGDIIEELLWQRRLPWSKKWGILDIDGHIILEEKYDRIVGFVENRAIAYVADENRYVETAYLLNEKGEVLKEFPKMERTIYNISSDGYAILWERQKGRGIIDAEGNWVLEPSQIKGDPVIQGDVICDRKYSQRVYYDLNGNKLFETDMDRTEYMDGYVVFLDEKEGSGLMNLSGDIVTRFPEGLEAIL